MKRSGCFILALSVFLCASLGMNCILFFAAIGSATALSGSQSSSRLATAFPLQEVVLSDSSSDSKDKVAVVDLKGMISSSISGVVTQSMVDDIKYFLWRAVEDANVKSILINIDSPGGEVTASDVIYDAITKAREKKPVVVYMGSVAASGGYYAACGGNYIMASDTTITGSIGVIIQTLNYQELLGKVGLDAVVFKSGKFKDILSGSREMTADERQYVQSLVMQTYGKFVGIVAKERGLPEEALRSGVADGRIVSGVDAKNANLIDELGYIEDAYDKARELGNAPNASVIRYQMPFRFGNIFRFLGESRTNKVELQLPQNLVPQLESGRMYLLPGHFLP